MRLSMISKLTLVPVRRLAVREMPRSPSPTVTEVPAVAAIGSVSGFLRGSKTDSLSFLSFLQGYFGVSRAFKRIVSQRLGCAAPWRHFEIQVSG